MYRYMYMYIYIPYKYMYVHSMCSFTAYLVCSRCHLRHCVSSCRCSLLLYSKLYRSSLPEKLR